MADAFRVKRNEGIRTSVRPPVTMATGAPPTARDALRRLEAVRTFNELVRWSHELRSSGLLGEDGFTNDVVPYWGRVWPGEVPPQAFSLDGQTARLPSGELVQWVGDWVHGQWRLCAPAPAPARERAAA
jgi:hypothetical protein